MPRTPTLILSLLLALPAMVPAILPADLPADLPAAEGWQADAFGLYRPGSDPERDRWAGLRMAPDGGTAQAPGPVVMLHFIVGPKSQPAGKDRVHLVALAVDAAGNLVAEGTAVEIVTGQGARLLRTTSGGIADLLHDPGNRAGTFVAAAASGDVQSLRDLYRVTADLDSIAPVVAPLEALRAETVADILLPDLRDRFGNAVEDGTALVLWVADDEGRAARLDAETLAGDGRARFLLRGMEGVLAFEAQIGPSVSPRVAVETVPLRMEGSLAARSEALPGIGAQRLVVGPFRTSEGHLLHDGVAIRLGVTTRDAPPRIIDTWLRDGFAEALLPDPPGTRLSLTVQSPLGIARPDITRPDITLLPDGAAQ